MHYSPALYERTDGQIDRKKDQVIEELRSRADLGGGEGQKGQISSGGQQGVALLGEGAIRPPPPIHFFK